ncbi:hypothetical protein [Nitrosopumilus sp.]|uniref:hypothetical protein n=1 Tax=Nitrosopumilus sp. TaxID=2024843 RepID=UPI00247B69FE|nr:hypothetical protein [Nitrosopumilus sp.]MCV0431287.1 hypothetical protein [Nitrosopumilus sp.]
MTCKNAKNIAIFSIVALCAIGSFGITNVFAEESEEATTDYSMADDVEAIFTFTFRDGIEVHKFPIFKMGQNFVDNSGVSFTVEGIITKAPHLYKALDESFFYRLQTTGGSSYEYDYRYFEVDVDFVKNGNSVKTLNYYNCEIEDYQVTTLNDDYESYLSSKTGFAVIDEIEFNCGGLEKSEHSKSRTVDRTLNDFGALDYTFANDVRTSVTFDFDDGMEKIEFPYFELVSGFAESADTVSAQFKVESVVGDYPLLYKAIDNARKVSGLGTAFNTDFDALVEFTKDGQVLRGFDFRDCIVESAEITTLSDKEEGFTGKSGFALVQEIQFQCSGLTPINDHLKTIKGDVPSWDNALIHNALPNHEFPTTNNVHAVATFTHLKGQEIIDFPIYDQGTVLTRSNPTFTLTGIVTDTPLLYSAVDINQKLKGLTGTHQIVDVFEVDVDLMKDDEVIRGFNYVDCRVTDYVVESQRDKEESYFKGFALSNTINFECQGYHPNNPVYDAMFKVDKANTPSSKDLSNTQKWRPDFTAN